MSANPQPLVIVGGVAGGASAATRARRVNEHLEIILFEKDEHVSFANCGLPYYIGGEIEERDKLLVATPEFLRQRYRLDVRTRQEVTRIDRGRRTVSVRSHDTGETYEQPYGKLILAPGAAPIVPSLEGSGAGNVFTLRNVADTDRICEAVLRSRQGRAVVVGAGYIGLEMAEQLARRGLQVALAELQPQVLPLLDAEMAEPLADALRRNRVDLHLGDGLRRIVTGRDGLAEAVELASGKVLPADLVLLSIGVRPKLQLAEEAGLMIGPAGGIATNEFMQTSDPDVYAVGDAAEYGYVPTGAPLRIALAGPANRAGRLAGEHAATGRSMPMAPVLGTSIVRVFDRAAGITGLTARQAERLGVAAGSATIVANQHAGYYPGAQPLTLKLVFAPDSGRVLGAQAVGGEGVDKRIDVIATLMSMGGTVRDLAGLDLCYAPPFGSAKDPVHIAAFVACNQLDGLERFVDPGADLTGKQVVDVRTRAEVTAEPLAGAEGSIQIPLDELRERLGELQPGLETVVSCRVGLRGHVAARILTQRGFADVRNLAGGSMVRARAWKPQGKPGT